MRRRLVEMNEESPETELLMQVVQSLTDFPEDVKIVVRPMVEGQGAVLTIHCAEEDRGRVIGRRGKTIDAIRFLFSTIASVHERKVSVRVEG
jgi:predicted RNA-binding protein YlqC (UPF0109 family)